MKFVPRLHDAIEEIPASEWDRLATDTNGVLNPLCSHAFLHALETSQSVSAQTGWQPIHLTLWQQDQDSERIVGAMPLYAKQHSYGEYVFDWAWAQAYERHRVPYYPKLLCAIPFTPCPGPRLLAHNEDTRQALVEAALGLAQTNDVSSLHINFPQQQDTALLEQAGMMLRQSVQFHWQNQGFETFEDYLNALEQPKRKKIRAERRKAAQTGVTFERLSGAQISQQHWQFFKRCYDNTYAAHWSTPYLNQEFFMQIGHTMAHNIVMVIASLEGRPVASSLALFNQHTLYGRHWGCIESIPFVHFEASYYQLLEFCIEHGIQTFEGGAQGEHKLARGFLPTTTWSAHWIKHPQFADAIEHFLARERSGLDLAMDEYNERSPFKHPSPS